jgi:mono/diheme cytochrome c family protein
VIASREATAGFNAVLAVMLCGILCAPARGAEPSTAPTGAVPSPGARIYDKWCNDCHRNPAGPGTRALERRYRGAVPSILEQRDNVNPELVKLVVRRGMSFMPSFRKTEISDPELAQVASYLARSK